jgi:pyruvate formate lyase activating enzyme
MEPTRYVAYATLAEGMPRAWLTLPGCNFDCRGCFSIARTAFGKRMTPDQVVDLLARGSGERYATGVLEEVVITGGEPTLDPEFLVALVSKLGSLTARTVLQTNAFLLDEDLLAGLIEAGLDEIICDLKAWDEELHRWYTGRSNRNVMRNIRRACGRVRTTVNTLLIPDIVGLDEIERMASFLSECDGRPEYRINPFRSDLSPVPLSRDPTEEEMLDASQRARKHLQEAVRSRSCLREREGNGSTHWFTLFPDGRMERRGMEDYRDRNRSLYGPINERR